MEKIKKFNEFVNENLSSGETDIPAGVTKADFVDKNGVRHKNGYRIVDGSVRTLVKLIKRLIKKIKPERDYDAEVRPAIIGELPTYDLNMIDVSKVKNISDLFDGAPRAENISDWNLAGVLGTIPNMEKRKEEISDWDLSGLLVSVNGGTEIKGDISGWDISNEEKLKIKKGTEIEIDTSDWDLSNVPQFFLIPKK